MNEDSLRDLWDIIKLTNIHILGVSERKEKYAKNLFEEIMTDNVPNLSQEHSDPGSPESSKETIRPRYITIKVSKIKESILKAAREKQLITYKGIPIRSSVDFFFFISTFFFFSRNFVDQKGIA